MTKESAALSSFLEAKLTAWGTVEADRVGPVKRDLLTFCEWFSVASLKGRLTEVGPFSRSEVEAWLETFFPGSGVFVGPDGNILREDETNAPAVWQAGNHEKVSLIFSSEVQKLLADRPDLGVYFWDWASQTAAPEVLIEHWQRWNEEGALVAGGPVEVPFEVWKTFPFAFFGVFREGFSPFELQTLTIRKGDSPRSFLKKAESWKNRVGVLEAESNQELPMIPFTLQALDDSDFNWPGGIENLQIRLHKSHEGTADRPKEPDFPTADSELSSVESNESPVLERASRQKRFRPWGFTLLGLAAAATGIWLWLFDGLRQVKAFLTFS